MNKSRQPVATSQNASTHPEEPRTAKGGGRREGPSRSIPGRKDKNKQESACKISSTELKGTPVKNTREGADGANNDPRPVWCS